MKKSLLIMTVICVSFLLILTFTSSAMARMYKFSGGPSGGTYQYYASAISTLAKKHKINVLASSSGGSIENIRITDSGKANFAVSYAGDVFQARNGMMKGDKKKYENVMAVAYFYGAPAQLIVRAEAGIESAKQLAGKRVGVGGAGSGAAASAELFFSELGLWDQIDRNFLGYREASDAFKNNQIDAFWVFAGFPNAAVIEAALQNKIHLVHVYRDAEGIGMLKKYPYLAKVIIPANTYKGVTVDTLTFQDSTLWVANSKEKADVVYNLLSYVYSKEGLEYMVSVHKSAKAMSIENGIKGIVTPLHPGAEKFWKEKGVLK